MVEGRTDDESRARAVWAWIAFGVVVTFCAEFLIGRWTSTHAWSQHKEFVRLIEADLAALVIAGLLGRTKGALACLIGIVAAWTCGSALWLLGLMSNHDLIP
jgi:hypothetical protein